MGCAIYCTGCNERFIQRTNSNRCPRCGAPVAEVPSTWLNETLLCRDALNATDPGGEPLPEITEGDELVGKTVAVYECQTLLGAGGMGRVYLARHTRLHRYCALKILMPRLAARDMDYVERFENEGRSAASLIHPNIVTIHATGASGGYHFLEMEFISGRSLQQLVNDEGRLTPVRATVLAGGIAEGLAAAHRSGVLHRDLKPDNVLLTKRGIPKIADFGLAKRVHVDDSADLVGTPNFMAPELLAGSPPSHANDVYSLGVCYFLLLTGQLPFVGGTLAELRRRVADDPLPNVRDLAPDVSLEMAECVNLLLARSPKNRPRDGIEASQLLSAVAGQARDLESLLAEGLRDEDGISWTRSGTHYEVHVNLPDGRRQTLFVDPSDHSGAERLLLIYSVCCPATPDFYEEALRINSDVPFGGLAIRDVDGTPHFVMVDTYPRATVDPEEIRRSILEIAIRADDVERRLTGEDSH